MAKEEVYDGLVREVRFVESIQHAVAARSEKVISVWAEENDEEGGVAVPEVCLKVAHSRWGPKGGVLRRDSVEVFLSWSQLEAVSELLQSTLKSLETRAAEGKR